MAPPADDIPPTASLPSPVGDGPTVAGGSAPADDDHTPPDAGRYLPVRFHRKGGMGRVFVARDQELGRDVALKDIRPRHAGHATIRRLFEFEAQITGTLEHPGVVPVYGMGRCPADRPFYAMRFIDGQSLAEAIRAFHAAPPDPTRGPERAAALRGLLQRFLAVCQTIAYAHSRGVIHRDLKPSNVMLGPFGETLLVDWGLAKRIRAPDPAAGAGDTVPVTDSWHDTRTLPGARLGTASYWAPEQARGEPDRHDERTDVYGLGAILFEILTGQPPNAGGVPPAAAPSPRDRGAAVDDELDEIVRTALAPDPDDRQQSAADLARQVDWWLGDQPVAGQRSAVRALEQEFARTPGRRDVGDQLARQRANLGLMYRALDQPMRAAVAFAYAVRWYEQLAADGRAHPRDLAELANCRMYMAECFDALGLADQAGEERQGARALFDRLIAAHPDEYRANFATLILTRPPAEEAETERPPEDLTGEHPPAATPAETRSELAPADELIQGYTILRPLGEGALGRVMLAKDNALDRLVAVKDFRADLPDALRRRAVREMQVTARLVHPNIVRVYTYGVHAGDRRPFMVMEFIPGQTLRDELIAFHRDGRRHPDPGFARLVSAVAQSADALHFAHTQGVLHRDPKPSNVMVTEDGRAVLIDWGLAKVTGATSDPAATDPGNPAADPALTQAGAVLGTPAYMAPERARGQAGPDPGYRGDVYALGAGLYEVLTGGVPFTGPAAVDVLRKVLFEKPPPPRAVNPHVPVELEAVCAAAMAYDPADRYPTAAALADDLRAYLAGQPVAVRHRGRLRRLWDQLTGRRV